MVNPKLFPSTFHAPKLPISANPIVLYMSSRLFKFDSYSICFVPFIINHRTEFEIVQEPSLSFILYLHPISLIFSSFSHARAACPTSAILSLIAIDWVVYLHYLSSRLSPQVIRLSFAISCLSPLISRSSLLRQ